MTAQANSATITLRGRNVSRAHVLAAISDCERLGRLAFLESNGYGDSTRYHLRHDGRSYPSKAILGAAAGLTSADFFGGARETVALLSRLGFHVRDSKTGELADPKLDSLRRAARRAGLDVEPRAWPTLELDPAAYFASGTNRPAEIQGFAAAGADIGLAAPEISAAAEAELLKLAGSDIMVFIDSGAFSEVEFNETTFAFDVVKPMTAADFDRVLSLYERLGAELGSQLVVVAPDQVGSQAVTLERLELYRERVVGLRALGVRILVAVQKGELSQAAFAGEIDRVLGFDDWTPAMPCKKAATTAAEVAAFVRARQPKHVHLLGLGIRSRQGGGIAAYVAAFVGTSSSYSLDSCWLTGNSGRTNGPAGGPRMLTKARDFCAPFLKALGVAVHVTTLSVYVCLVDGGLVR